MRTSCVNCRSCSSLVRGERQRRVVEIGGVLGVPGDEPGRGFDREVLAGAAQVEGGVIDVAVGEALEVARHAVRREADRVEVAERVVAVAVALVGVDDAPPQFAFGSIMNCALANVPSRKSTSLPVMALVV